MQLLKGPVWAAAIAFLTLADAAPSNLEGRNEDAICRAVKSELGGRAKPLCNDYLGQPSPKTITLTSTTTQTNVKTSQLAAPTTRTTVHVTTTIVSTTQFTTYSENPTSTSVSTVILGPRTEFRYQGPAKRDLSDLEPRNYGLRWVEEKYGRDVLRSACQCIAKQTQATRTTTARLTLQTTRTVFKQPLSTKVVTSTITVSALSQVSTTTTLPPTSTVTIQSTTTMGPPPVILPAVCNARGLPGANAFNYDANFNTNQQACINSCKTDNRCLAVGFYIVTDPGSGTQTGTCRKYDKPVQGSADLGPGYYNWNDKDCPA